MRAALRLRPLARPKQAVQVEVTRGPAPPTLADRGCRQRRKGSTGQHHRPEGLSVDVDANRTAKCRVGMGWLVRGGHGRGIAFRVHTRDSPPAQPLAGGCSTQHLARHAAPATLRERPCSRLYTCGCPEWGLVERCKGMMLDGPPAEHPPPGG
eukprot:4561312-Prymnesium_polylepis.1